jgi:hypothetical protein
MVRKAEIFPPVTMGYIRRPWLRDLLTESAQTCGQIGRHM